MPYPRPTCLAEGVRPAPPRTVEGTFPGDMASARAARGMVRDRLGCPRDVEDDCALIVSELVANAVVHGGSAVRLRLMVHSDWIYGEIADDGKGLPCAPPEDLAATDGRGLLIVGSLTRDWGVFPLPGGGKIVWFILGYA